MQPSHCVVGGGGDTVKAHALPTTVPRVNYKEGLRGDKGIAMSTSDCVAAKKTLPYVFDVNSCRREGKSTMLYIY